MKKTKNKNKTLFFILLGAVLPAAFFVAFHFSPPVQGQQPLLKEDEILVKFKNSPELSRISFARFGLSQGDNLYAVISNLNESPAVEFAEPIFKRKMLLEANDYYYSYQWYLDQDSDADIDAGKAWNKTTGEEEVIIAVIDSGLTLDHEDIFGKVWTNDDEVPSNGLDDDANGYVDDYQGWDFVDDDNDPMPQPDGLDNDGDGYIDYGVEHGTHVAGISAGSSNNGVGITGVCWQCQIMPLQVLNDEGWGDSAGIASAINYAVANGAQVINMSLGSYGYSQAEALAVADAVSQGVVVVAAVGNDAIDLSYYPNYPSCYDSVLGIAATDYYDEAAYFSNYGEVCVDLAAPGDYIYSTVYPLYGDYYGYMSGTSMASPVVAGTVGLMFSYYPQATLTQIRKALRQGANDLDSLGTEYGAGRLNANRALAQLIDRQQPTAPTHIYAYTNVRMNKSLARKTRTAEASPYFKWSKGTDNRAVAGYYVYWGTNKQANPYTRGDYQTKKNLKKYHLAGNEKSYYLKIKSVDASNNVSATAATFKYIIDNQARAPYDLTLSDDPYGIYLAWSSREKHLQQFVVYRRLVKDDQPQEWEQLVATTDQFYFDQSAVAWKKYQYRVRAIDDLGNHKYSGIQTIKHRL